MSKEKMLPVTISLILMVVAVGVFVLFDAYTQFSAQSTSYLSRLSSNSHYWLFYRLSEEDAAALNATAPEGNAKSVPVLIYHGEGDDAANPPLSVIVEQMRALKRNGWRTISLQQFHDFMKHGESVPDKSFLLTFDDGRRDTFYPFDPVMKDLGFTGVMYVITAFSIPQEGGRPSRFYLNRSELQYMVDSGRWELQSHGNEDHRNYNVQSTTDLTQVAETKTGHFLSNKFWNDEAGRFETDAEFAERVRKDLETSRDILEEQFGNPVYSFAYPFNDTGHDSINFPESTEVLARVVPSVYTFALYQHWPGNGDSFNYPDADVHMIRRIEPKSDWGGDDIVARLEQGRAKDLPYATDSFGTEWAHAWGTREIGDTLSLHAASTSGAASFLDGSGWWTDYRFEADVNRISGSGVLLIARNTNDTSYVTCAFSQKSVTVEKQDKGNRVALVKQAISFTENKAKLGIAVQGQKATCYVNGAEVAAAQFTGLEKGGIGVEVWDLSPGQARSEFTSVSVQPL